jgi:hypothetical protein
MTPNARFPHSNFMLNKNQLAQRLIDDRDFRLAELFELNNLAHSTFKYSEGEI